MNQTIDENHIIEISLEGLSYKIYLPYKESDYIEKTIAQTKSPYELDMLKDIAKRMHKNEVFIDAGANILNHSLFIAAKGFKVYAFEANKMLCDIGEKSIALNHFEKSISLFNYGLGDKESLASFVDFNWENMGGNSLNVGAGDIKIKRLDDFEIKEKIGVIKIDVEGMEREVLLGAEKTIKQHRPLIYAEAIVRSDFNAINEILENWDYTCYDNFNATPTHLFIPGEKLNQNLLFSRILSRIASNHYYTTYNYEFSKKIDRKLNQEIQNLKNDLRLKEQRHNQEIQNLKNDLRLKEQRHNQEIQRVQSTLSFKWGNRLVKAKSFKNILNLPYGFYKDYKEFKARNHTTYLSSRKILYKDINLQKTLKNFELKSTQRIKIACVLDEFSYSCFESECELLYLSLNQWKSQLLNFKPDLLLVESAWSGIDSSWTIKISKISKEIIELFDFCKENNIPSAFWAKEDPIDFGTFFASASKADFVFTTDIDSIGKYKYYLGHGNVYCLPFAANANNCNPIEKYKREDSFCFAGAYYKRHSSRSKDFKNIIESVKKFKPIIIYDRNYGKNHEFNTFPQEYQNMIIGNLKFNEIDKAYKGYNFGININTLKNSQTMFARRVFELLASNTLVVSNFSRAIRNFFGDLVISCDNALQIEKRLEKICTDELILKKFKLLGLRKVMYEHTYKDRLDFILGIIFKNYIPNTLPQIFIFAKAHSLDEFEKIIKDFKGQKGNLDKKLLVFKDFKEEVKENENVIVKLSIQDCLEYLLGVKEGFFGIFHFNDFYGENYLLDLILACKYSENDAFGKGSFYSFNKELTLNKQSTPYTKTTQLNIRSSLVNIQKLNKELLSQFLNTQKEYYNLENMLCVDCFNYCENGAFMDEKSQSIVKDLSLNDEGIVFKELYKHSTCIPAVFKSIANTSDLFSIPASKLYEWFSKALNLKYKIKLLNNELIIDSKTNKEQIIYSSYLKIQELNLNADNSQFVLNCKSNVESFYTLIEFFDENKQKISSVSNESADIITLGLSQRYVYMRFNLSIKGKGKITIKELILDSVSNEPFALLNKSKILLLTRQYPSYDDLYKFGFVHSRIKAYKEQGVLVDVLRLREDLKYSCYEFENIDVMSASPQVLEQSLKAGLYTHILVHFLDEKMWEVLKNFVDKVKILVWVHGYEIQAWQRREFEFENLNIKEIEHQKKMSAKRLAFWQKLLKEEHKNLHLIFVSEHFKNTSLQDLGVSLKPSQTSIIHNYINTELFAYIPKDKEDRKKILSVSPFASRVYANDLMVAAIEELSQKDFFEDLEFCIIGDGVLFDDMIEPLRKFKNVIIHKKFLKQNEISKLHRKYGVFLRPTRLDSQGVSRDEAMSSGLVPISTKIAAVPEFVDENCGILTEPEDPKALARAIEFLYFNPNEFLRLSYNAAQRVRKQSSYMQTIQKELDLML